jgi:D-cysteine desulfhydrase
MTESVDLPLSVLRPALRSIPRVSLCTLPSPVQEIIGDGASLWIKRDDLSAPNCGGNKARTLEWLLAPVRPGDTVLTLGGEGSTHVLATATHAARLGAQTIAYRWRHEMNATAQRVAPLIETHCTRAPIARTTVGALLRAHWYRLRHRDSRLHCRLHYVPPGGSIPLGVLAHVNAAIELAVQVRDGILPRPSTIVLPLGSGGTMAGLVLGLAIARLDVPVTGVQVTPSVVANRWRVKRLIARTAALIERITNEPVARPHHHAMRIDRHVYGGAYGRTVPAAVEAAEWLTAASGIRLDYTYSAKAFAVALALARNATNSTEPILFWNTFDGRLIDNHR